MPDRCFDCKALRSSFGSLLGLFSYARVILAVTRRSTCKLRIVSAHAHIHDFVEVNNAIAHEHAGSERCFMCMLDRNCTGSSACAADSNMQPSSSATARGFHALQL